MTLFSSTSNISTHPSGERGTENILSVSRRRRVIFLFFSFVVVVGVSQIVLLLILPPVSSRASSRLVSPSSSSYTHKIRAACLFISTSPSIKRFHPVSPVSPSRLKRKSLKLLCVSVSLTHSRVGRSVSQTLSTRGGGDTVNPRRRRILVGNRDNTPRIRRVDSGRLGSTSCTLGRNSTRTISGPTRSGAS